MNDATRQPQQVNGSPPRAAYRKPGLKEFGSVGMLTQAGTGTLTELMVNMMISMAMTRRN
jgi:hypothetical protein